MNSLLEYNKTIFGKNKNSNDMQNPQQKMEHLAKYFMNNSNSTVIDGFQAEKKGKQPEKIINRFYHIIDLSALTDISKFDFETLENK